MNENALSFFLLPISICLRLRRIQVFLYCLFTLGACQATEPFQVNAMPTTREQWQSLLKWAEADCPLEAPDEATTGVSVHDLGANSRVVEVECERYAYQGTRLLYLLKNGAGLPLKFDQYESPDVGRLEPYQSPVLTGLLSVDARAGYLEVLRKYRGVGDCGQYLRYRIEGDHVILHELRVRECGKLPLAKTVDPKTWPLKKL